MLLRLYDDCGVNPLGGWVAWRAVSSPCPSRYLRQWRLRCIPSLAQFPIFIGLYRSILKLSQINPKFQAHTVLDGKHDYLCVFPTEKQSKSHAWCQRSEILKARNIANRKKRTRHWHAISGLKCSVAQWPVVKTGAVPLDSKPGWTFCWRPELGPMGCTANTPWHV